MKKIIVIAIVFSFVVGAIALLFYNKQRIENKAKKTVNLSSIPVTVAEVKMDKLSGNLTLTGVVNANSEVNIISETQGRVVKVFVDVGDYVAAGKTIAQVDDELKQAALLSAEANLEKSKKDFERYTELNSKKSANDAQLEAATLAYKLAQSQYTIAKRQLNDTKIISSISGIVTSRPVEQGTVINNGTLLATIVDISILKIKVNVSEKDVFKLKIGNEVVISTDVYPVALKGKIKSIGAKADEAHTYPVEILIRNSTVTPLKAGMFAQVTFKDIGKSEQAYIPREALVGSIKDPKVYVVRNGKAYLQKVEVMTEIGKLIEIRSGLAVSDIVVTNGQINLKDGDKITVIK